MTEEKYRELVKFADAFYEGKVIEGKHQRVLGGREPDWTVVERPSHIFVYWDWEYRIKPEPIERWAISRCGVVWLYSSRKEAEKAGEQVDAAQE